MTEGRIAPSSWRDGVACITAPWPEYVSGGPHRGIDFACGVNKANRFIAVESGIVVNVVGGSKTRSGYVEVQCDSGHNLIYKHGGNFGVKIADEVEPGDVLATPNYTNTDSLHLHFEVWVGGDNVNPLEYLLGYQPDLKYYWSDDPSSLSNKVAMYYKKNYSELYEEILSRRAT